MVGLCDGHKTQVLPESADLKPGGSATFRVAFRPPRDAAHYCQTLALCAHIKSMRNFRLLTDSQVILVHNAGGLLVTRYWHCAHVIVRSQYWQYC